MSKFCLIGERIEHSLSPKMHKAFGIDYSLVELKEDEIESFIDKKEYDGFNVTIPYKKAIMKYCDYLDDVAANVGAVNVVVLKDGKYYGYNTDVVGFETMLNSLNLSIEGKDVLILGTGGTSNTVEYVCKNKGAKSIKKVSRNGDLNYSNVSNENPNIIINTTPVGMYPNVDSSPIDIGKFNNLEAVLDVIYNPKKTKLIKQAEKCGIKCIGGLIMLASQGVESYNKFTNNNKDLLNLALEVLENE